MLEKPKKTRKKTLRNPVPTDEDFCEVCGSPYAERHEPLQGVNRQKSIQYGLQVKLCRKHHREAHNNIEIKQKLQKQMQEKFEREHPDLDFLTIFGRNYL